MTKTSRTAWGTAAILAMALLVGVGLLFVRLRPYWVAKYRGNFADLRNARLPYAPLAHAMLVGANLTHADLSGAHLAGAMLCGADLTGGHLAGADLTGAT